MWNLVNALRDDAPRPSMDVDHRGLFRGMVGSAARESVAESLSESLISASSKYNGSRRDSQDGEEHLPWRVGPTPTPGFMRRPETRVYYTSSADVADLIDQLSSDLAGAARGRIDIRPTSPGGTPQGDLDDDEAYYEQQVPSIEGRLESAEHAYEPGQFSDAPSPMNAAPKEATVTHLRPDAHHAYAAGVGLAQGRAGDAHGGSGGQQFGVGSPSAASFTGSDISSPEQSVQDRLQALMDRLRAAPGGVGRVGGQ